MRRTGLVAVAGSLGAALLVVSPLLTRARAAEPLLAGLDLNGVARGLEINFGFRDFVIEKIVDVGIPHASTELNSEGGGQARAVASQFFPGDLIAGAAGEQLPGYREANFPTGKDTAERDANDDAHTAGNPLNAGPLSIVNSHLKALASETASSALVTTSRFALGGPAGPVLSVSQFEMFSDANGKGSPVVQEVRSSVRDVALTLSPEVTIKIGELRSTARSTSDGQDGEADANFTVSDVEVVVAGVSIRAAIDQDGLTLTGFPEEVPPAIRQSLTQKVENATQQTELLISTPEPTEIVEDASSEASVGGLLIRFQGTIPSVFLPGAAATIMGQIIDRIPTMCFRELEPQQIFANFPVPLCFTPAPPGGGTAGVTSITLGAVRATASAARPFTLPPVGPPIDGVGGGDLGGGFVAPPPEIPFDPGTGGAQPQPQAQPRRQLYGLVAKMPPGALLGAGAGLLVFAIAVAMGPSLRRWRPTAAP